MVGWLYTLLVCTYAVRTYTDHWESLEEVTLGDGKTYCVLRQTTGVFVRGMCHTMHSGYPWRLFYFEEKVKSVVKSVFAVRGHSMYCVSCAPSMH